MWFGVISIFPEMFSALNYGIVSRAIQDQLIQIHIENPRNYCTDKHQTVDDKPYGGGPGMLMKAQPLLDAITQCKTHAPHPAKVIYLSPQGKTFNQGLCESIAQTHKALILIAGRYEGIDERIIQQEVDEEWSIGDFILSGGEFAAMTIIDSLTRLVPGSIGDPESVSTDSISSGLLKYPQYTRPETLGDMTVPEVLLSGNHQEIARWRLKQALGRTWQKRPDMLEKYPLDKSKHQLLDEFIKEIKKET